MNSFITFLKSNKALALALGALCLMLLLFSLVGTDSKKESDTMTLSEYEAELEERLGELCSSVEGVGKCRVFVTFESGEENLYKGGVLIEKKPPRVLGVSVVCHGGDKLSVQRELSELFTSLFGISSNRVKILKLK